MGESFLDLEEGGNYPDEQPRLQHSSTAQTNFSELSEFSQVKRRIAHVQKDLTPNASPNLNSPRSVAHVAAAFRDEGEVPEKDAKQPWMSFGFRPVVTVVIAGVALVSCGAMFECAWSCWHNVRGLERMWQKAEQMTTALVTDLVVQNVTKQSYAFHLTKVEHAVTLGLKVPADEAVDTVWNVLRSWWKFGEPMPCNGSVQQRQRLLFLQWAALEAPGKKNALHPHVDGVSVAFEGGQHTAVKFQHTPGEYPRTFFWERAAGSGASYSRFAVDAQGNRGALLEQVEGTEPGRSAAYLVQETLCKEKTNQAEVAWSPVHRFAGENQTGLAFTKALAYCGNCSCLQGVISADVGLEHVNAELLLRWQELSQELAAQFTLNITKQDSAIFVMSLASSQAGLLVGASHREAFESKAGALTEATKSPLEVVSSTSRAILVNGTDSLVGQGAHMEEYFTYRVSDFRERGKVLPCEPVDLLRIDSSDCRRVATLKMGLDARTTWLAVLVLPVGAFTSKAQQSYQVPRDNVNDMVMRATKAVEMNLQIHIAICAGALLLSVLGGVALGHLVSWPLRKLGMLMRRLGELDFAQDSPEWREFRSDRRSRIVEIARLQQSFWSLSQGIKAFSHFVPEAVVRSIMHGDSKSMRLHVRRKEVTVLFSDIQDFTAISESMRPQDILFLLTRYHSVMTHIVEMFEGIVAEVLGDGLLCFWNTPEDVADHASKACMAALAMQQALVIINEEITVKAGLGCSLAVRIGIHTGTVLSGNIGSVAKMKFGCIGDTVNTASRLESLCKHYGVTVLCSASTSELLPPAFCCRRLDLVQVKGKLQPVTVFEVMGRTDPEIGEGVSAERKACAGLYEAALERYQAADFTVSCELLQTLIEASPGDRAAEQLLGRAARHAGSDGGIVGLSQVQIEGWTGVLAMDQK